MNHKNNTPKSYSLKNTYFSSLAGNWDEQVGNTEERIKILHEILSTKTSIKKGDNVLDLGCGTGILIPIIHSLINDTGSITAVDSCAEMLQEAKKKHSHLPNVNFIYSLIEDLKEPENKFDVVTAFAVFPHINDKKSALKKIRAMLKNEGRLYIFHLSKTKKLNAFHANLDAPVKHDLMPNQDEMKSLFADTGFTMIKYTDIDNLNFIEAKPCL